MTSTRRWTGSSTSRTPIEAELARRHLAPEPNPSRMALFDLSSSWMEGRSCPLAARGYSRDGKKGKLQIEYGLLTDPEGRPVAVRVFPGNTGDPAAFTEIVQVVRDTFGLANMVMVGDRGMITCARIRALNQLEDGTARPDPYGWITALRAPAIRKLMADDGPLQLSLFDQQDLAEITSDDFPGERLIACRNPVLAADRARTREDLLAATEKLLAPIAARVAAGRLAGAAAIGVEVGKVISKYKTAKHFDVTITDDSLAVTRRQDQIDAEAALDGFYVLRTPVPASELDAPGVVAAYKNLKYVERDFRHIKSDDLDLRPVFHRLEERVKAHVLICMLACYLTWHLRKAWAPLTFTDQTPPEQANPVTPARRSAAPRPRPPPARPGRPALPQLPRADRAPSHPDPQPGPVRRHPGHHPDARRAHQRPARSLPPDRRPGPAHLEVARTNPTSPAKPQIKPRNAFRTGRNFGLSWTSGGPGVQLHLAKRPPAG